VPIGPIHHRCCAQPVGRQRVLHEVSCAPALGAAHKARPVRAAPRRSA
jgi:hypothetical protein